MKTLRILAPAWIILASAGNLTAQSGVASDSIRSLPEVVISANRQEAIRSEIPEAIGIVAPKEIQSYQSANLPSALIQSPGVFVQKTNLGGGSPFLRGLTGNQTLLLIDGIRLSNAATRYGPNQYLNTVDVFGTERIEVMRGSGSVQYGSDAIGGVVQVITVEPQFSEQPLWKGSLLGRIATGGMEQSLHGDVNYSAGNASFRAGASLRRFGDIVGGDTTGRQVPTGYNEMDFDLKGKVRLSSSTDLTVAFQNVVQTNVPVYHKVVLENYQINRMNPQKRSLAYFKVHSKISSSIIQSLTLGGAFQFAEEGRELRKKGSFSLRSENDKIYCSSFSADVLTAYSRWSANSGIDIYYDRVRSSRSDRNINTEETTSMRGLYPDKADMLSMAAFSLHTVKLDYWNITAGIRYNAFVINVPMGDGNRSTIKPSALVGNLALLRKISNTSNLFVSANSGFRAPNIDDLGSLGIVDFRYESPNMDLKPENSLQFQLGYKHNGQRLRGELYLYRNQLYNLIVRNKSEGDTIEGYPVYRKENSETAYIHGIETAWEYSLNRNLNVSGHFTWTYGQNTSRNEPVRRIPPVFGGLSAEYNQNNWRLIAEWLSAGAQTRLAAGDREDNRIPVGGTPAWNVFNIYGGYRMKFMDLDLSILNILNKDYRYHGSGINGCGRSAFLTLRVNIG